MLSCFHLGAEVVGDAYMYIFFTNETVAVFFFSFGEFCPEAPDESLLSSRLGVNLLQVSYDIVGVRTNTSRVFPAYR